MLNTSLVKFEAQVGLGATYVARMLGIAYPTYAAYRSGSRELPHYHQNQIELIMLLSEQARQKYIKDHAYGT